MAEHMTGTCADCGSTNVAFDAPAPMTDERALDINGRLVLSHLHRDGITEEVPDLDDVTASEALEAARIAAAHPGSKNADGTTLHQLKFQQTRQVVAALLHAVGQKKRPVPLTPSRAGETSDAHRN